MPAVELFLTYATYKVIGGKPIIHLFGRTKNGQRICVIDRSFEPHFFVKVAKSAEDVKKALVHLKIVGRHEDAFVTKIEEVTTTLNAKPISLFKVTVNIPSSVPIIKREVSEWDSVEQCFEYDIKFTHKYLLTKNVIPLTLIKAQGEYAKEFSYKVPVLDAVSIEQITPIQNFESSRVLAIDIETYHPGKGGFVDMDKEPIIMIGLFGDKFSKVVTYKNIDIKDKELKHQVEIVQDEAAMLSRAAQLIDEFAPDIITGYNSDSFDLPYIAYRAQKHKVRFDIGLDGSSLIEQGRQNVNSNIIGIVHIDIFKFIRRVLALSMKTDRFTLDAVSEELLGKNKTKVNMARLAGAWDEHHHEDLELFAKYNLRDCELAYLLHEHAYPLMSEISRIISMQIFDSSRMSFSQLVESFIMHKAIQSHQLIPNKPHGSMIERQNRFKGAFVLKPEPGLYHDLAVLDFRSLYPTILASHNISIDTLNCSCCKENKAPLENRTILFCTKKEGFLAQIMKELIELRKIVKQEMKQDKSRALYAKSQALKYLCNAFYGYLGFAQSRWYCLECAEAITAWGRFYINKVIDEAKEKGFGVVYGDTDSTFLKLGTLSKGDAINFVDHINQSLPGLMELELQGFYPSGLFVTTKSGEGGAKKRYALLDEKGGIKITGFEVVRRNTSPIARDVQQKVIEILLREKDAKKALKFVQQTCEALRAHNVPVESVVIFTQITKPIDQYESVGPHVAAAQRMKDKGQQVSTGSYISYVVCKGAGKIRDKVRLPEETTQNDYDPEYYINNQVLPSVEKIFEAIGHSKEEMTTTQAQSLLGKFF